MTVEPIRVLVADDEPDVLAVTRLSLRAMQHSGRPVELVPVTSGVATVEAMRADPGIAVILLDVVMESDSAGLDACRAIREELGNRYVRILLRTGQPGAAPERATIDDYDIDGYLPKAELTTNRLYAAVRTALKAFDELVDLDRHRRALLLLNETAASLHPYEPLRLMLERVLGAVAALVPTPLAVVGVELHPHDAEPIRSVVHLTTSSDDDDPKAPAASAAAAAEAIQDYLADQPEPEAGTVAGGYVVPFTLHEGLGRGWLFAAGVVPDVLARSTLPLLAAHAANAVYAAAFRVDTPVSRPTIMESGRP